MGRDNVQNEEIEIDIGHILSILWDKIMVIIATGIIVGLGAFLVAKFFITPQYESETKLYVLNRANDSATTLSDVQLSTQLTKTVVSDDPYQAKKIADCVAKVSSQKICDIMKIEQVNVIEEGSLSEIPAFAVVQKWTIIGALAGIVLSAAVIVIKSMLDDTVKTTEDVEKYFDLSTLAVIPISEEMDDGLPKNKKKSRKNKKNKNKK